MGMEVLGISVIANMAAGIADRPLRHEDVLEAAARAAELLAEWLARLIPRVRAHGISESSGEGPV